MEAGGHSGPTVSHHNRHLAFSLQFPWFIGMLHLCFIPCVQAIQLPFLALP